MASNANAMSEARFASNRKMLEVLRSELHRLATIHTSARETALLTDGSTTDIKRRWTNLILTEPDAAPKLDLFEAMTNLHLVEERLEDLQRSVNLTKVDWTVPAATTSHQEWQPDEFPAFDGIWYEDEQSVKSYDLAADYQAETGGSEDITGGINAFDSEIYDGASWPGQEDFAGEGYSSYTDTDFGLEKAEEEFNWNDGNPWTGKPDFLKTEFDRENEWVFCEVTVPSQGERHPGPPSSIDGETVVGSEGD